MTTETAEMKQDDPKFLPTKMGVTEYRIRQLRKEYDVENLPAKLVKGDDAYQQVHSKVMSITKIRTGIEKVRKELKADALKWGQTVDAEARRLTELVVEIEAPWKLAKLAADEAQAKAEQEAREAEQKRVEAIEAKVVGLQHAAEGLLNASAEQIKARLDKVRGITITEDDYEEFYDAAVHHHQQAIEMLTAAHAGKVQQEEMARQIEEQKRQLAEQQAVIDREAAEKASLTDSSEPDKPSDEPQGERNDLGEPFDQGPVVPAGPQVDNTQTLMDATRSRDPFDEWWQTAWPTMVDASDEVTEDWVKRIARAAWNAATE